MIEGKTKDSIVKNFETAAKEFNFSFVAPYCIGENNELSFLLFCIKKILKKV